MGITRENGFWFAVASALGIIPAYLKYKSSKQKKEENNMSEEIKVQSKRDVKNMKEAIVLLTGVLGAVHAAKADGKIDLADAGLLLPLIPKISPAIEGIGEIPGELSDLDEVEAGELVTLVGAELGVIDEKAKKIINASFKALAGNIAVIKAIKE